MFELGAIISLLGLGVLCCFIKRTPGPKAAERAQYLLECDEELIKREEEEKISWGEGTELAGRMKDRLGRAGFVSDRERKFAKLFLYGLFSVTVLLCVFIGFKKGALPGTFFGSIAGLYLGVMAVLYFLRYCRGEYEREVLFQIPLVLESLILLVESGFGILPAMQRVVEADAKALRPNPTVRFLRLVYEYSLYGMPLAQALETVTEQTDIRPLRHVLLHLDVSGSEGGALGPSLRSLSEYAHTEWRLSVEQRVKRLENLVVFPVFVAVIGLMFLTAAVPLVPVLELRDILRSRSNVTASSELGTGAQSAVMPLSSSGIP